MFSRISSCSYNFMWCNINSMCICQSNSMHRALTWLLWKDKNMTLVNTCRTMTVFIYKFIAYLHPLMCSSLFHILLYICLYITVLLYVCANVCVSITTMYTDITLHVHVSCYICTYWLYNNYMNVLSLYSTYTADVPHVYNGVMLLLRVQM